MSARERNRQAQEEKEMEKKAKERARQQRMARQYINPNPAAAKEKQAARLFAIPTNQWEGACPPSPLAAFQPTPARPKQARHRTDWQRMLRAVGDVCQWVDYIGYGQHKLKVRFTPSLSSLAVCSSGEHVRLVTTAVHGFPRESSTHSPHI